MKKIWRIILFCSFMLLALFGSTNAAQASSGSNNLPPGFLVGDDTGFQAGKDGEYFILNNDIEPGQSFDRVITLSNYSTEDGNFAINLVMNPEDNDHVPEVNGAVNLLEAISVTLTYQGDVIYEGPISGDGTPIANQKSSPIALGTLEVGEVRNIQAEFTVSDAYPDSDWKEVNSVDFYWLFYASREDVPEPSYSSTVDPVSSDPGSSSSSSSSSVTTGSLPSTGGKLPQTGEDWRNVLLGMIAGLALVTVALIIAKKRRNENQ